MNGKQAITSALQLICVFAIFLIGFFFICLPYLPDMRMKIIHLLNHSYEKCTHIGLGFFLASLFLLISFYALNRGRYLVLKMGVSTNIKVIKRAVEDCFLRNFPQKISLKDLEIGSKSYLDFKVSLSLKDEKEKEDLYIQVEEELHKLLKERFGYSKPFNLIVCHS